MSAQEPGNEPEDRGLVTRVGPLEVDWPKSLGYYGGIGLAVAFELIEPPLALAALEPGIARMRAGELEIPFTSDAAEGAVAS